MLGIAIFRQEPVFKYNYCQGSTNKTSMFYTSIITYICLFFNIRYEIFQQILNIINAYILSLLFNRWKKLIYILFFHVKLKMS